VKKEIVDVVRKITLTTGVPIVTHHVESEDVYALAKKLETGPFRLFSMAFDAESIVGNDCVKDYSNFRANGIIPEYVKRYIEYHNKENRNEPSKEGKQAD
jgi:hypothetical protein